MTDIDPVKNDANKLFIVESSEMVFRDIIRTTVGVVSTCF